MNNRLLTALAISVVCAGGAALAGQRLNTLNNLVEGPHSGSDKPVVATGVTLVSGEAIAPSVPLSVDGMTAAQLIEWMKKQGYKFVVETTNLPGDRRFDVQLKGAKESEAIEAIAAALGLRLTKKGEIFVLSDGFAFLPGEALFDMKNLPDGSMFREFHIPEIKGEDGLFWFGGKELTKEQRAEIDKALAEAHKAMEEAFRSGMLKALTEKEVQEHLKQLKEGGLHFKGKALTEAQRKEMEQHLKQLKDGSLQFRGEALTEAQKKELEQHLRGLKDGALKVRIGEELEGVEGLKPGKLLFRTAGIKAFVDSLTAKQKNLQTERGFLLISDLSEEQREMLGLKDSSAAVSLTFTIDGKTVTVKSSEKS